jgi:hypothetical protein
LEWDNRRQTRDHGRRLLRMPRKRRVPLEEKP